MNASRSAAQLPVRRVMAAADSPASDPKNSARAGTKFLVARTLGRSKFTHKPFLGNAKVLLRAGSAARPEAQRCEEVLLMLASLLPDELRRWEPSS